MKKIIQFKKKLIEDTTYYGSNPEQVKKIDRRIIRALRTAEAAKQAAANAEQSGDQKTAKELYARAEELETWANIEDNKFRDSQEQENKENKANSNTSAEDVEENKDNNEITDGSNNKADSSVKKEAEVQQNNIDTSGNNESQQQANQAQDTNQSQETPDNQKSQDQKDQQTQQDNKNTSDDKNRQQNNNSESSGSESEQKTGDSANKEKSEDEQNKQNKEDQQPDNTKNSDSSNAEQETEDSEGSKNNQENKSTENSNEQNNNKGNSSSQNNKQQQDAEDNKNEDESQGSNQSFNNPFNENPTGSAAEDNQQDDIADKIEENPDEFEDMKKILAMLKGGEAEGAKKAFNDLLSGEIKKVESLNLDISEAFKPITKDITSIDDAEFEDIINATIDEINKVKPVNISADIKTRVTEIEKDNASLKTQQELADDDKQNTAEVRAAQKAAKKELEKYRNRTSGTANIDAFKNMLRLAIKNQVADAEEEDSSWSVINRRHQEDDIVAPGEKLDDKRKKEAVSIQVYLDCSGSFDEDDIIKERGFLSVIDDFVRQGKVAIELIYFANTLHSTFSAARREGGTSAWPLIIKNIRETKPANVLIVTDSDMNFDAYYTGLSYTTKGCVWYIWKGSDAKNLPKYLNGLKGTYEYWLN